MVRETAQDNRRQYEDQRPTEVPSELLQSEWLPAVQVAINGAIMHSDLLAELKRSLQPR